MTTTTTPTEGLERDHYAAQRARGEAFMAESKRANIPTPSATATIGLMLAIRNIRHHANR